MSRKPDAPADAGVRLDKWLWAARFFKTRNLASDAITAGHVKINGDKGKPARCVKVGDVIRVRTPADEFEIVVQVLSEQRGPASQAQLLYAETDESKAARANNKLQRAMDPVLDHPDVVGRPTKRLRRQLNRFQGGFE